MDKQRALWRRRWVGMGLAIGVAVAPLVIATPGDLDGFNFTRDSGDVEEDPVDVVVGASGKIYVLNRLGDLTDFDYRIQRFNADGSVDTGFGINGALDFPVAANLAADVEGFFALAIDEAADQALVGGVQAGFLLSNPSFVVKRLNISGTSGTVDTTFGTQGRTVVDVPNQGVVARMAIDASGRIVLAGIDGTLDLQAETFTGAVPRVVRLSANGAVDNSFAQTAINWGGDNDAPAGVFVQADGKILVTGAASLNAALEFGEETGLARLMPNGGLDSSFGSGGVYVENFEPGTCEDNNKVGCEGAGIYRPLAGGKFLVTVYIDRTGDGQTADTIQITRFNGDGSLDGTFGTGGQQRFESRDYIPGSVPALLPDDSVVLAKDVAGTSGEDLRLYQVEGYSKLPGLGPNLAPIAVADTFVVSPDSSNNTLRVLLNDSDPNGDPLRVKRVFATSQGGTATRARGNRTIVYTPAPGFAGTESFSYQISDGRGGLARASVTVQVNAPPIAVDDVLSVPATSRFHTLRVLRNDSDPEGASLSLSALPRPRAANGRARITTAGLLQYRPNEGFIGTDSFTYEISDGLQTARATVTVTVGP